jgi:hypothetical protein
MIDIKTAKQLYETAGSLDELEAALRYHNYPLDELLEVADAEGWHSGPAVMTIGINGDIATPESIATANKAAVRNLQVLHNMSVISLRQEALTISPRALEGRIAQLAKTQKILTELELGIHGLATTAPPTVDNPIVIAFTEEEEEQCK